jgi:serine/threonine protein kinase/ABC-type branched-subunit amino acid transport system substrate-binding protein
MMNRYKVVRFIGRGGMGAVYLCEDLRLPGKQWALKEMILHDPGVAEQVRDSFQREAQFLAGLRHRSLPLIVDVFSLEDRQYLVMEYIHGETLAQRVQNRGVPSDTVALSWALELAQVLDYLHRQERPIIFRDLKPENIIVTDDGHIKVIDFGLARHFEPGKHRDTQASGTVGYAPPEQWEDSGQSDPRSDIYSLAATLFYVLTGKPPSPIYGSHRIRPYRPDIDPGIEALVLRCLQPDPSQRYRSAAELIKDLLILLSEERHQSVMHRPESAPQAASQVAKNKHAFRPGPLKPPLRYPQKLPFLLGLGLVLFLIGGFLPFVSMGPNMPLDANGHDPITELLEDTEESKNSARALLAEGKFEQAIATLDALLTRFPQDAEAHILKNNAYVAMSGQQVLEIPVLSSWHGVEREGYQLLFGYALAQTLLNKERLSKKPLLSLKLYDDRSDSERLLEIIQEILNDPKAAVLIGPYTSQAARLVAPLVNGKGLPTITPVASDPQLLATGPYLLCVSDTDAKKVRALAERLYKDGGRKAAVFANESSILSRSLAEVFVETFQSQGGLIALNETYPANQLDFARQAQIVLDRQADCVFLGEYRTQPVVGFCETLRRMGLKVMVAAQTPGYSENLFRNGKETVEGLYLSTYYVPGVESTENRKFLREFQQMFGGRVPSHREVQAYDTLRLAVDALDAAGLDRPKVLQYLKAIGTSKPAYHGVSGTFAPAVNLDARPPHVLQVREGAYQLLK